MEMSANGWSASADLDSQTGEGQTKKANSPSYLTWPRFPSSVQSVKYLSSIIVPFFLEKRNEAGLILNVDLEELVVIVLDAAFIYYYFFYIWSSRF